MGPIEEMRARLLQKLQETKANRDGSPESFNEESTDVLNKAERGNIQDVEQTIGTKNISLQGMGMAGDPEAEKQFSDELQMRQAYGDTAVDEQRERYIDPEAKHTLTETMNLSSKFSESIQKGAGDMLGSFGDLFQYLGSKIPGIDMPLEEGNMLSRFLQEQGVNVSSKSNAYASDEAENPTFSWSTFANPEFWAVQGGRFVPQLTEIMATMGIASLAKKGVQKGVQYAMRRELKDILAAKTEKEMLEASSKLASKGYQVTTGAKYGNAVGITEVAGRSSGLRGFLMTDRGFLTNRASQLVQGMAGGGIMNQRVSLSAAGENYNTYNDFNKQYKEEHGVDLFTQEELAQMASQTYINNSSYAVIDMFSWGLTFGKGFDKLKSSGLSPFRKAHSGVVQQQIAGNFFTKATSPILKAGYKLAKKAIPEGLEETFQETWEEWSKMKAYEDVRGTMSGYQGKVSQEYKNGLPGFFDYYMSKDSESLRAVAGAMGAVAGGAFNLRVMFDNSASLAHKMNNRSENLKLLFKKGSQGKARQQYDMRTLMSELVFEGKGEHFGGFLSDMYNDGTIDEKELNDFQDLYNHATVVFDNVSDMNLSIPAKKAIMNNVILGNYYDTKIDEEEKIARDRIKLLENTIEDPKELEAAILRENDIFENRIAGLLQMKATAEENVQNIIKGKPANLTIFDTKIDEYGNETIIMGTPESDSDSNEDVETRENVETHEAEVVNEEDTSRPSRSIRERMKAAKEALFGKKNKGGETVQTTAETVDSEIESAVQQLAGPDASTDPATEALAEVASGNIEEGVEGSIEALTDNVEFEPNQFLDEDGGSITSIDTDDNINGLMPEVIRSQNEDGTQSEYSIDSERKGNVATYKTKKGERIVLSRKPKESKPKESNDADKQRQAEIDRIKAITDPEERKVEEIKFVMANLFGNVGESAANKMKEYAERIHSGKETRESVIKGLAPAFVNGIDSLLSAMNSETSAKTESNTDKKSAKEMAAEAGVEIDENEESVIQALLDADNETTASESDINIDLDQRIEEDDSFNSPFERRTTKGKAEELTGEAKKQAEKLKKKARSSAAKIKRKARHLAAQTNGALRDRKAQIKNIRKYNDESQNFIDNDLRKISEMMAVNDKLDMLYSGVNSDYKPSVYLLDSIYEKYGARSAGYTIAGAIYINGDRWDQDAVYMHEMAHIMFQMTANTPHTRNFLKHALRNKKLVDYVKDVYWDQELVGIPNSEGEIQAMLPISDIAEIAAIIDQFPNMDENQVMQAIANIQASIEANGLVRIPQEQQHIWNEEIFTHSLEGPLSQQYNKFFDPHSDSVRKVKAKSWWRSTKDFFSKKEPEGNPNMHYTERDLLEILSGGEIESYNDSRAHILKKFREENELRGTQFSLHGRSKRIKKEEAEALRHEAIVESLNRSVNHNLPKGRAKAKKDQLHEQTESQENRYENRFESNLNNAETPIAKLMKQFISHYNKYLALKFINSNPDNYSQLPVFDGDYLRDTIYQIAKQSFDYPTFYEAIVNSEIKEVKDFATYMDARFSKNSDGTIGPKQMMLQSMFWVFKNKSDINGVETYISQNGEVRVQDSMNRREQSQIENALSSVVSRAIQYSNMLKGVAHSDKSVSDFNALAEAGNNIKLGIGTKADVRTIVEYFAPRGVRVDKMIEENRIVVSGKAYPLDKVVASMVRSPQAMNIAPYDKNGSDLLRNYGAFDNSASDKLKSSFRSFIKSIVITNRKYTVDETVMDSTGNQNPVRITDNFLTRGIKNMEIDAKTMTEKAFVKKYSNVNKSGKGALSNNLLKFWHKMANNSSGITINQNMGAVDAMNKTAVNFPDSTSEQQRFNDVLYFASTQNKDSYVMDAGRFSDSSRSFMLEVPMIDFNTLGRMNGDKFEFNKNASSVVDSAYQTYKKMNSGKDNVNAEDISLPEFVTRLNNGIESQIKFMNDNASKFSKLSKTKDWFTNGKLNQKGKMAVANMEINNTLNGVYFAEIFLPSYQMNLDYDKRAKQLASPFLSFLPSVGMQTIYFADPEADAGNAYSGDQTDGIAYMLADPNDDRFNDIKRISQMGGSYMDLGNSLKMVGSGVEYQNETFKNKNIYDKPKVEGLNEEIVRQQPRLRPLYERLKAERQKYIDSLPEGIDFETSLSSGNETHLLWAVSATANKSKNLPEGTNTDHISLENINNQEASDLLDNWYYKDGKFQGLDGQNYGIQTVMDKETYQSVLPVQLLQSIITNADLNGNTEALQATVNAIVNTMHNNFAKIERIFTEGTNEEIFNYVKDQFDLDSMDQKQRFLVEEKLSISIPGLRTIALNTIANSVKRNSNKLTTAGAITHSAPSFYEKTYGDTNGSNELQDYQERVTYSKDGNRTVSYSKIEAVVPKHLKGKLTPRTKVYMNSDGSWESDVNGLNAFDIRPNTREKTLAFTEDKVKSAAGKRGVGYGPIYKNGVQVGWYLEGDTILVTRIPSHGVQTTGVAEVVDFNASESDSILLPKEFIKRTGGDHDGDAIFVNHKQKGEALWNQAFDDIVDHWMSPRMHDEVMQNIEYSAEAKDAVNASRKLYGKIEKPVLHHSSEGRAITSDNTIGAKSLVGLAANLNTRLNQMRAYNIEFNDSFIIDGVENTKFHNVPGRSISISSAKMMNLVIDNSKNPFAKDLNLNEHTLPLAMILTNLGYNLTQIGAITNNPIFKAYTRIKNSGEQMGAKLRNQKIREIVKDEYGLNIGKINNGSVTISTSNNVNSEANLAGMLRLLNIVESMNSDILKLNSIMSGHTNLEKNVFILKDQLSDFKNAIENKSNKQLNINDDFRNDPIVKNYIRTAESYIKIASKIDPTSNAYTSQMYNDIISGTNTYMSPAVKNEIQSNFEVYNVAMAMGLNNTSKEYMKELTRPSTKDNPNPKNIFDRLQSAIDKATVINDKDLSKSVQGRSASLLFAKGLRYSLKGRNQYISINDSFFSKSMTPEIKQLLQEEFNSLDKDLMQDLMLYDLFTHQWKGSQSMFPLFDLSYKKKVSQNVDYRNSSNPEMTNQQYSNLIKAIVAKNHNSLKSIDLDSKKWTKKMSDNRQLPVGSLISSDKMLFEKMKNGEATFFKYTNPNNNKQGIIYFPGFTEDQKLDIVNSTTPKSKEETAFKYIVQNISDQTNGSNVFHLDSSSDYISIITANPDPNKTGGNDDSGIKVNDGNSTISIDVSNALNQEKGVRGMSKKDPYLFKKKLSRSEFDVAMEYNSAVSETAKAQLYDDYLIHKKKADSIYRNRVNEQTVKNMTDEELLKLYGSMSNLADGEIGYGYRNLYAYSNVNDAIQKELFNRISLEQESITGKKYDGKDITPIQKWMMSNNVPSNHPAVQGIVRKMEVEYKKYIKEKKKYTDQINEATNELYKEKFGLKLDSKNPIEVLKTLYYSLFKNRVDFYNALYGSLTVNETIINDEGNTIKNMRYKTPAEIEAGIKDGSISAAQKKFYDVTTSITNHLKQFNLVEGDSGRANYIPHTAPALLETFSRRGMLGLMVNSKTIDERINDVVLSFTNPITGEVQKSNFKEIRDMYSALSATGDNSTKRGIEFAKLKRKAISLARQQKNEDGSPLRISNIEVGSALGDVFVERFSNARSRAASDFPSMDLNKAFVDYVSGTMFTNGNEEFGGFKKMLPVVDGVLTHLKTNSNDNMAKYVEKIWKQYFLGRKKQGSGIYNSKTLETFGVTSDDTIDFLTKTSLLYWLGWKGLAIGGGVYAVGNVLVGKYKNVVNNGGKAWKKGEARFWGVDKGFNTSTFGPRKANEILKRIGFMDINVYDDVNVETKNSFEKALTNVALSPMIVSERWIQGVQFLGLLTDQEWESLKAGGSLDTERLIQIEDEVKRSQGKGYQATDQRMIQLYSWGRNMMQFSRYLPTMMYELASPRDIDRYGKQHIGTYRMAYEGIQKVVMGNWNPKEFVKYRSSLDVSERRRLDSALMGFGLLGILAASGAGGSTANDLFWDSNAVFDIGKLQNKLTSPSVSMVDNLIF